MHSRSMQWKLPTLWHHKVILSFPLDSNLVFKCLCCQPFTARKSCAKLGCLSCEIKAHMNDWILGWCPNNMPSPGCQESNFYHRYKFYSRYCTSSMSCVRSTTPAGGVAPTLLLFIDELMKLPLLLIVKIDPCPAQISCYRIGDNRMND